MPDAFTPIYNLTKPEVGGSADSWGGKLNANMEAIDGIIAAADAATLKKASNLSDLTNKPLARENLGLSATATKAVGTGANTVAAGDDSRITGALQASGNLSDLTSSASARASLDLKGAAVCDVGTSSSTVAAGNDSRIVGALQKTDNLQSLADKEAARGNLGLAALARLDKVNNDYWLGAALAVANGGTGAASAESARTNLGVTKANLGLGNADNKSAATILGELTPAHINTALGKSAMRVNAGTGANSGLVSWGTSAPSGTPDDGQIYLQYDA